MRPKSVANWDPKKPTKSNQSLMEPNAKDNPDTLTPSNMHKQAVGKSGKPGGPFGKAAREF